MFRLRADLLLVARGLAESRAKARAAIEAGGVRADGAPVAKASDLIARGRRTRSDSATPLGLARGREAGGGARCFRRRSSGRICLDVGASTGGFTQVLLARGAARVYAVDVGRGQLHAALRADPRVVSLEKTDARALTRDVIADAPSLVVCDASFIGAAKVLKTPMCARRRACRSRRADQATIRGGARKGGVLAEADARAVAHAAIVALNGLEGFGVAAQMESPIRGGDGNLEILLHARR